MHETPKGRGGFCPVLRYLALKMITFRHARCLTQSKIRLALMAAGK